MCVSVCVPAPAPGRIFWVRGPCSDAQRPSSALHCRLPALAGTKFILGKLLLFLFPSSSAPHLLLRQIECAWRRKTEAKGKEIRSFETDISNPGGFFFFFFLVLQEVDISLSSDSPYTVSTGVNGAVLPSSLLLSGNKLLDRHPGKLRWRDLRRVAPTDPPLHFGESKSPPEPASSARRPRRRRGRGAAALTA